MTEAVPDYREYYLCSLTLLTSHSSWGQGSAQCYYYMDAECESWIYKPSHLHRETLGFGLRSPCNTFFFFLGFGARGSVCAATVPP